MKREIKFRQAIFNGENKFKRFEYWGFIDRGGNGDFTPPNNPISQNAKNNSKQFTGLTDKNGVEIYEGDIICFPRTYLEQPEQAPNLIREVKYSVDCFRTDYDGLSELYEDCEIIGNIFENPELMEVTK